MIETKQLTELQTALFMRLMTLAEEARVRGELAESERLYREVLHFLELVVDPNHVEIAKAAYKLAQVLALQEKQTESLSMFRRARQIIRLKAKQTLAAKKAILSAPSSN